MLLLTTIKPRRDGTVTLRSRDGTGYVFKPNEHGDLVAEVGDNEVIAAALLTGDFEPYDEADHQAAADLLLQLGGEGGEGAREGGEGPADGLPDDDPVDENAPPVEAQTPPADAAPAAAPARRKKG